MESHCFLRYFYANYCVESHGIVVVVHFNVPLIFADCFPNTFYAETMPALIRFIGGQAALWV